MNEINVSVKVRPVSYRLVIGHDLFPALAKEMKEHPLGKRVMIISDSIVAPLWAGKLQEALDREGISAELTCFPAGEASKVRSVKEMLEDELLKKRYGRDTVILALGGGVTGDMAGYVGATYMRGVPVIQIPTTTLSMADSSIGGKTAVDTPYGKNLIGAFHHPALVVMDMNTLTTLDDRNYYGGLAELIKHGFIKDPGILTFVEENLEKIRERDPETLEALFTMNCQVKNYVVSEDDQEKSLRQILNYGHTMGHAVEIAADLSLQHGECVAIGMVFAGKLAVKKGLCSEEWAEKQKKIIESLGLPTKIPADIQPEKLIELMLMDKKTRDGVFKFVLPVKEGEVVYGVDVASGEILEVLKEM